MIERDPSRYAVVTGAASGIGRSVAQSLIAEGIPVALLDIDEKGLRAFTCEIGPSAKVYPSGLDITSFAEIQAVHSRMSAGGRRASIIINCAGWSEIQPFLDNDQAFWRKAMEVNLLGTIAVTRVFLDDLIADGAGKIVNVASDAGRVGSGGEVVYSAAKGGVISFTKSLAREMAKHRISVNCVCPGPTETPMLLVQDQTRIDALIRAIPMRRLATPADIAGAVTFLASPAANYITGQVISVSGGLTMAG